MPIPHSPLRKTIDDPVAALRWAKTQFPDLVRSSVDRSVVTPILARYLFDFDWDLAVILDACRYHVGVDVVASHSIDLGPPTRVYNAG